MTADYCVVIDSGSLGSRVQVYRWDALDEPNSPPRVVQEPGWSLKITPGVSSFAGRKRKVWKKHYKKLLDFALSIVPDPKRTPVYVLSTAGMRLLKELDRRDLLKYTCKGIRDNTNYYIGRCENHIQTINGETEGTYGWIALNYLLGTFSNYSADAERKLVGFMDMGGASTQLAFVPSQEQAQKNKDALLTVHLSNMDGSSQKWPVFVETWLGFGANQARQRHLQSLLHFALGVNLKSPTISDPCMPKGAVIEYEHNNIHYTVEGSGNYDQCVRAMYPLLMKHVPCSDEPCLFNGVHSPAIDFATEKFVGVSEYWYTANDVFHAGGEYEYESFSSKVRDFCNSDWNTISDNLKNGAYSISEEMLLDACFKASWVISVLHDGYELPKVKQFEAPHIPFTAAESINDNELSWTLGKAVIVASQSVGEAGIYPSAKSQTDTHARHSLFVPKLLLLFAVFAVFCNYTAPGRKLKTLARGASARFPKLLRKTLQLAKVQAPSALRPSISDLISRMDLVEHNAVSMKLEEGTISLPTPPTVLNDSFLRTRSSINLVDDPERPVDSFLKPFVSTKKNGLSDISRISSSSSMRDKSA